MLGSHYPGLFDVWTNHIQPFLLPNVVWCRKRMGVVHYELTHRIYCCQTFALHYSKMNVIRCSLLRFDALYISFWLTNDMVMVISYLWRCPSRFLLHILGDGTVHCSITIYGQQPYYFHQGRTSLLLDGKQVVFRLDYIGRDTMPEENVCQCMWRAVVLHSIRHRE